MAEIEAAEKRITSYDNISKLYGYVSILLFSMSLVFLFFFLSVSFCSVVL